MCKCATVCACGCACGFACAFCLRLQLKLRLSLCLCFSCTATNRFYSIEPQYWYLALQSLTDKSCVCAAIAHSPQRHANTHSCSEQSDGGRRCPSFGRSQPATGSARSVLHGREVHRERRFAHLKRTQASAGVARPTRRITFAA